MGGSSKPQEQKTTYELSPEQRELMNIAMPGVREFAASTPQRYQGSQVAGFTEPQIAGQNMALGAAPVQAGLAKNAAGANNFYTSGDIWNPSSNPNLQGAIDASVRPIYENLTEKALPAIRQEAITAGGFGGSRQGIAEGIATREASRAAGDTASKLAQSQYDTNVNAQLKALALTPTIQGAQTAPSITTSGVGDVQQALQQALLNQDVSGFNFDQYAPFMQSKEIMALLQGLPGGTAISTANSPTSSPWGQALGGAATGASLGSALMPGIGTGIGALGGALLPFLFR